jgi:hypothetical protein
MAAKQTTKADKAKPAAAPKGPDRVSAPADREVLREPVVVHAYRRAPNLDAEGKEKDVEVQCYGEKIKFRSNAKGHIVGTVTTRSALDRLVKEIPEAYIVYADGDNVPERTVEQFHKPVGEFVLTNGKDSVVLDGMNDADLREFAATAGIDAENLPDVLTGDTLKRAIFNTLKTGD